VEVATTSSSPPSCMIFLCKIIYNNYYITLSITILLSPPFLFYSLPLKEIPFFFFFLLQVNFNSTPRIQFESHNNNEARFVGTKVPGVCMGGEYDGNYVETTTSIFGLSVTEKLRIYCLTFTTMVLHGAISYIGLGHMVMFWDSIPRNVFG
jgi:hypothetical protein